MESLPSKNIIILDVPEVKRLSGAFQYNFWTFDEFENGLGSTNEAFSQISSETFDSSFVLRTKNFPRIINLTWHPTNIDVTNKTGLPKIKDFFDKIHSEETFTSNDYTSISYQDNQTDNKLKFFTDQLITFMTGSKTARSPMELAEFVNNNTPNDISSTLITQIISNLQSTKGLFFKKNNVNSVETALLNKLKDVVITSKLNNRLLTPIVKTIQEDSLGLFADEFSESTFVNQIKGIENSAIINANANLMSPLDYEFEIMSYVDYRPVDTVGYKPTIQTLGYVISKREIKSDGSEQIYSPIIVENPTTTVLSDCQIRYGSLYYYKLKTIYLVETFAFDEEKKQNLLVSFMVSSQYTKECEIKTVEMVPPPAPSDFNINWDYGEKSLRCTWNLPVNSQRDIKYIQLFRRKTIKEPFQLIKMWDFNDTTTKIQLNEFPSPHLIEKVNSFIGFYLDKEFGKDSNYIYSVCAIDAHGLTSNYSIQFQANFDKFANKLIKKLVSVSGAPKQYPNAFLNQDTFVDTIKDSGHSKLRLIFNPEYMQLIDSNGNDLNLLKTTAIQGKYRLQMINIDFQTQTDLDIILNDSRKTVVTKLISTQNIIPKTT